MKRTNLNPPRPTIGARPRLLALVIASSLSLAFLAGCEDEERVLAKVNGEAITQPEFDAFLDFKRIPADDEKRREKALEEYLEREGLAEVIEDEKVLDQSSIEAELDEFRKEMMISRYFDEFLREKVTDEAIKNYYETNAKNYEEKKVHVAHILVRTHKRMSEEERKAKLTTAQEVYAKLQSGEDFAELAKQFSEDKISGSRGGDLGWIKEGTIDARFSKRAFEAKVGTTTEPFETPFGFHILKVVEEPKTVRRPFAAVAGDIRYQLRNEAKEAELKRLREAVKISKEKPYELDGKKAEEKKAKKGQPDRGQSAADGGPPAYPPRTAQAGKVPSKLGEVRAAAPGGAPRPAAPSAPTGGPKAGAPQAVSPTAVRTPPTAPAPQQPPARTTPKAPVPPSAGAPTPAVVRPPTAAPVPPPAPAAPANP